MSTADPLSAPPDAPANSNFLAAAVRRWPWVVIGVVVGTAVGFFALYLSRSSQYQSTAQLLVIKKRGDAGVSGADGRMAYLEDYVAIVLTLLKSERMMLQAASNPATTQTNVKLDEDQARRARQLSTMLTAARDKETNATQAGNNVVNLTIKGADPTDCQNLLKAIISTYQKELATEYDEATQTKIDTLNRLIAQIGTEIEALQAQRNKDMVTLSAITPEDVANIRARVTRQVDVQRQMENELADVTNRLEIIKNAGTDPRNRALLLAQLSETGRGSLTAPTTGINVDNPDSSIKLLELERAELLKKYRPDHPAVVALDTRLSFMRELLKKTDTPPTAGSTPNDALHLLSVVLTGRKQTWEAQLARLKADLNSDTEKVAKATGLQSKVEDAFLQIRAKQTKMDEHKSIIAQTQATKDAGGYLAREISTPSLEPTPIAPKLLNALLAGAAGGLLLGLGLAALAEMADKSFRSPAEIRARLGLPVIGHIPPIRTDLANTQEVDVEPTLVTALRPKSVEAEAYRGVRTALYFSTAGKGHAVIQVTSPNPGDGKSTLAANLAASIAQSGKSVLLVDCDFRRPRMHKIFRMTNSGPGFVGMLADDVPLAEAVRRCPVENLSLLPCGTRPSNPSELLTSPRFQEVIDEAQQSYDFVVLDTPPLLAVSDPAAVASRADGVILVFRMTNRARPQAERAREQLAQLGANVLGVVVNGAGRAADGYGYGSGAGYHYDYEYEYADSYQDADEDSQEIPKKG